MSRDRGTNHDVEEKKFIEMSNDYYQRHVTHKRNRNNLHWTFEAAPNICFFFVCIKIYCPPFCDIKFERRTICNFSFDSFFLFCLMLYITQNIQTFLCDSDLKRDAKKNLCNKKSFYKMMKQHKEKRVGKYHLRHVYYYLHSCHLRFS